MKNILIKLYLKDIINHLKQSDTWKNKLIITINFVYSEDNNDEERVMDSKSDNRAIMISDVTYEIIEKTN